MKHQTTPQATLQNVIWLREYAAKNNLKILDLVPEMKEATYSSIRRWLNEDTSIPSRRAHKRALAAYRTRTERKEK